MTRCRGYYWPTILRDSERYAKEFDKCQKFAPMLHLPTNELTSISSPWLFIQWGLDIIKPLPQAPTQKNFILVATNYFSKWIETESHAAIEDTDLVQFI